MSLAHWTTNINVDLLKNWRNFEHHMKVHLKKKAESFDCVFVFLSVSFDFLYEITLSAIDVDNIGSLEPFLPL